MKATRILFLAGLVAMALTMPGCFKPQRDLTGSGMDMFAPTKMRIHPLTRVVADPPQIEARIEFHDQMDDVTKGVGKLQFILYTDTFVRERAGTWDFDLAQPQANKETWDGITRTYLCKLPLKDKALLQAGKKYTLKATMDFPNKTQLENEFSIIMK